MSPCCQLDFAARRPDASLMITCSDALMHSATDHFAARRQDMELMGTHVVQRCTDSCHC